MDDLRLLGDGHDILDGTIPDASLPEKAKALDLLGQLRAFEAAESMISQLAVTFPEVKDFAEHPAVKALKQIGPAARPALMRHISTTTVPRRRKLLTDTLTCIEGKVAATAILDSEAKTSR